MIGGRGAARIPEMLQVGCEIAQGLNEGGMGCDWPLLIRYGAKIFARRAGGVRWKDAHILQARHSSPIGAMDGSSQIAILCGGASSLQPRLPMANGNRICGGCQLEVVGAATQQTEKPEAE